VVALNYALRERGDSGSRFAVFNPLHGAQQQQSANRLGGNGNSLVLERRNKILEDGDQNG
jgi:hypothetical protein